MQSAVTPWPDFECRTAALFNIYSERKVRRSMSSFTGVRAVTWWSHDETGVTKTKWVKKEWLTPTLCDKCTSPSYEADVCAFLCPFQTSRGPLEPAGKVMKYLQRDTKHFLFRARQLAQAASWVWDQLGQVELKNWQEHEKERKTGHAESHPFSSPRCDALLQKQATDSWKHEECLVLPQERGNVWRASMCVRDCWAVHLQAPSSSS